MKQFEPVKKELGGYTFYIRPLPAFKAAKISGELAAVATPLLGGLAPILGGSDDASPFDVDIEKAAPAIAGAFSSLSGDKVEKLMKALLTDYGTISVEGPEDSKPQRLTEDLANEVFCGETQDMFVLAFHVINVNFGDFFSKLGSRYGSVIKNRMTKMGTESTES